jgi:ribulose-5-phosphate 4-epimerase/fuculose-1-phosphate aldolase
LIAEDARGARIDQNLPPRHPPSRREHDAHPSLREVAQRRGAGSCAATLRRPIGWPASHGWSDLIFTHLTARLPGRRSSLPDQPLRPGLRRDHRLLAGQDRSARNKLDDPTFPVNKAGFVIHSAIHAAREDVVCVIQHRTRAGVAVSAQKSGLLPISQQSTIVLGSLGYHDYEGIAVRADEQPRLQKNLGDNKYLMLRNHGLLTVGRSVADAFLAMYVFETACQIQATAQAGGELIMVEDEVLARNNAVGSSTIDKGEQVDMGSFVWPALLRKLDRIDPGYRS